MGGGAGSRQTEGREGCQRGLSVSAKLPVFRPNYYDRK